MHRNKGFTLIELLVVIAIIGILSSVVLASLNSAREKSRDAKRVSDVKQLQLALELYFDAEGGYPDALTKLSPDYIPSDPVDPLDDAAYEYNAYTSAGIDSSDTNDCDESSETCTTYHLGSSLEADSHTSLDSDSDTTGGTVKGADTDGCSEESGRSCYDVTP